MIRRALAAVAALAVVAIGASGCAAGPDADGEPDDEEENVGQVEQASSEGCSYAPGGYVCNYVRGSGLNVTRVSAIRGKNSTICNYSAYYTVVNATGGLVYRSNTQRVANGGCSPGRAWFDWNVNQNWRNNYRICVHFFEGNVKQGGSPCVTIRQ